MSHRPGSCAEPGGKPRQRLRLLSRPLRSAASCGKVRPSPRKEYFRPAAYRNLGGPSKEDQRWSSEEKRQNSVMEARGNYLEGSRRVAAACPVRREGAPERGHVPGAAGKPITGVGKVALGRTVQTCLLQRLVAQGRQVRRTFLPNRQALCVAHTRVSVDEGLSCAGDWAA